MRERGIERDASMRGGEYVKREPRPRLLGPAGWALAGLVLALAYTQAPLFSGNQNTKFLIGLARAGYGSLSRDWLANTTDPFPLFTALVRWTAALFPPEAFYVYSVLLFAVYVVALVGIGSSISGIGRSRSALFVYFALLVFMHSRLFGRLSALAIGWNAPRLLHFGVANQYILGRVFQPCVFGVLLPLSVLLFLRGRHRAAALLLGASAAMHPAYVLGAVCLALAYAVMRRDGRGGADRRAVASHPSRSRRWPRLRDVAPSISRSVEGEDGDPGPRAVLTTLARWSISRGVPIALMVNLMSRRTPCSGAAHPLGLGRVHRPAATPEEQRACLLARGVSAFLTHLEWILLGLVDRCMDDSRAGRDHGRGDSSAAFAVHPRGAPPIGRRSAAVAAGAPMMNSGKTQLPRCVSGASRDPRFRFDSNKGPMS
jgi:hypothetical protein